MVKIIRKGNEHIGRLLNRFKKKVRRSRIIEVFKDNQRYTKPSTKKKEARKDREHKRKLEKRKK